MPIYDKDINVSGIIVPAYDTDVNTTNTSQLKKTYVEVSKFKHTQILIDAEGKIGKPNFLKFRKGRFPEFEIVSNPTIKISEIKTRRFS
jgi:hypothetical protein